MSWRVRCRGEAVVGVLTADALVPGAFDAIETEVAREFRRRRLSQGT